MIEINEVVDIFKKNRDDVEDEKNKTIINWVDEFVRREIVEKEIVERETVEEESVEEEIVEKEIVEDEFEMKFESERRDETSTIELIENNRKKLNERDVYNKIS